MPFRRAPNCATAPGITPRFRASDTESIGGSGRCQRHATRRACGTRPVSRACRGARAVAGAPSWACRRERAISASGPNVPCPARWAARRSAGAIRSHGTGAAGSTRRCANRLTAGYAFREASTWLISFSGGTVVVAGERLEPGCHVGRAEADDPLRFDDARNLRLRVPAGDETCGEDPARRSPGDRRDRTARA